MANDQSRSDDSTRCPADVVNLRQVRKAKAREASAHVAETNRAKFGRTKAEKARDADRVVRAERALDGHRIEPDAPRPLRPKF